MIQVIIPAPADVEAIWSLSTQDLHYLAAGGSIAAMAVLVRSRGVKFRD